MPFLTTQDGCNIYYTIQGSDTVKRTIIFLNGTTQTTLYWGATVPAFAKHFRLVFYDARAQGQSDLGAKPISLQLHVADLEFLMAQLGIGHANLVGISHGARVALALAVECPDRADRLVLCSLGAQTSQRSQSVVLSWLHLLRLSGVEAMAWAALPAVFGDNFLKQHQNALDMIVKAVVKRNRKKALIAQLEALLHYPPSDAVPTGFKQPTMILTGAEDPLVIPENAEQLAYLCKGRHKLLAGIGHSIPAEAPRLFEKLVLEFLGNQRTEDR